MVTRRGLESAMWFLFTTGPLGAVRVLPISLAVGRVRRTEHRQVHGGLHALEA